MTKSIAHNVGGPAFPIHPEVRETEAHAGMSLRDWFAGQALQSIGAWSPLAHGGPHGARVLDLDTDTARRERARWAYSQADAMLAERSK